MNKNKRTFFKKKSACFPSFNSIQKYSTPDKFEKIMLETHCHVKLDRI